MCDHDCCWIEEYLAYNKPTTLASDTVDPSEFSNYDEDEPYPWERKTADGNGGCSRCMGRTWPSPEATPRDVASARSQNARTPSSKRGPSAPSRRPVTLAGLGHSSSRRVHAPAARQTGREEKRGSQP
jgi:hypothetical protein